MSEYNLVSSDGILAVLEDKLSSYSANGLLDVGKFYREINWFNSQLNLALYEMKDAMIVFDDHKAQLPCDFFSLDSAWLCHKNHRENLPGKDHPYHWREWQDQIVVYTHKTCDTIAQGSCPRPEANGIVINAFENDNIIERVTIKEYVEGNSFEGYNHEYHHTPHLLKLGNKLTMNYCSKNCKNFRGGGHDDISIKKQGNAFYMYSNMKHPLVFIRYFAAPIDPETKLPLVVDHPIIQKALEDYLTFFFVETMWVDSQDVNLENKLKYLAEKKNASMAEVHYLVRLPKFSTMRLNADRSRDKYRSFEIIGNYHN